MKELERLKVEYLKKGLDISFMSWLAIELSYARERLKLHEEHDERVRNILKSSLVISDVELKGEL